MQRLTERMCESRNDMTRGRDQGIWHGQGAAKWTCSDLSAHLCKERQHRQEAIRPATTKVSNSLTSSTPSPSSSEEPNSCIPLLLVPHRREQVDAFRAVRGARKSNTDLREGKLGKKILKYKMWNEALQTIFLRGSNFFKGKNRALFSCVYERAACCACVWRETQQQWGQLWCLSPWWWWPWWPHLVSFVL